MLMPGPVPKGGAIRLGKVEECMGVAEGIETAFSASKLFGLPVWSLINTSLLARWRPPAGVKKVMIFGDADPKLGGHAAAYRLGHRLACAKFEVSMEIPKAGDWNDNLLGGATP